MIRKIFLGLAIVTFLLPVGCATRDPVPWGWYHNKRRVAVIADGYCEAGKAVNRLIFQDITTWPDKYFQASQDFDRIFFGMEERFLEDPVPDIPSDHETRSSWGNMKWSRNGKFPY